MSEPKLGYITLFDKQGKAQYRACNAVDRVDYLKSMATRKMRRLKLYSAIIEWDGYVYFKREQVCRVCPEMGKSSGK